MNEFDLQGRPRACRKGLDESIGAEKKIEEKEKGYRNILEGIEDFVAVVQNGKIVYRNPAFERFAENQGGDVFDTIFPDWIFSEERDEVRSFYRDENRKDAISDRYATEIEFAVGRRMVADVRVGDIEYEGMPAKLAVMRDVTRLLRQEREYGRKRKMEAISTVTGGFAHDFNNILGIVLGYGEMALEETGPNPFLKKSLNEICAAALRGKEIIIKLLGFSYKRGACLKAIFAGPLFEESLKRIEASAPSFVGWKRRIACEGEMIAADQSEIETVLANICSNSANSFAGVPGNIRVEAESAFYGEEELEPFCPGGLRPGEYVRLEIADSGCGIDPRLLDKVFDPYFTTASLAERSGMGLSVVYGVVNKCNGGIRIDSRIGVGTTVELLFPVICRK